MCIAGCTIRWVWLHGISDTRFEALGLSVWGRGRYLTVKDYSPHEQLCFNKPGWESEEPNMRLLPRKILIGLHRRICIHQVSPMCNYPGFNRCRCGLKSPGPFLPCCESIGLFVDEWKWNESGFRPPLCTYRVNWTRRSSWGWWDDWDDTVLQTQDSKFEPWRSEVEYATSRSRRLYWLSHVDGEETFFVSFKPPGPGTGPRTLAWKAAVLTTTLGPPPNLWKNVLNPY